MKARGDKDVFPSSSFLGEYVSLEGCELQTQDATKGFTLFSDEPRTKARSTFLYRNPPKRNPEHKSSLQQLEAQPTKGLGALNHQQHLLHKSNKQVRTTRCLGFPSGNPRLESLK